MEIKKKRITAGLGVVLLVLVVSYLALRPWHLRWGATGEDVSMTMPGDLDGRRWTRAITIDAPPEQVWPWLVQWGQGRGGWYSYDWLENLMGFDIHSANRILLEHQDPQIGDPICMARGVCNSSVAVIELNRWFGWQSPDENGSPVWTFMFGLSPLDGDRSRLVLRESFRQDAMPAAVIALIEIPDVIMEQKALATVKNRAEGVREPAYTTPVEIIAWLTALASGLAAAVLFVRRRDWRRPLLVGLASVIVLMLLTFTLPPLWLRAALDIGLLAGLVWITRQ